MAAQVTSPLLQRAKAVEQVVAAAESGSQALFLTATMAIRGLMSVATTATTTISIVTTQMRMQTLLMGEEAGAPAAPAAACDDGDAAIATPTVVPPAWLPVVAMGQAAAGQTAQRMPSSGRAHSISSNRAV